MSNWDQMNELVCQLVSATRNLSGHNSGENQDAFEDARHNLMMALTSDAKPEAKVMTRAEFRDALVVVREGYPGGKGWGELVAHDARLRELLRRQARAPYLLDNEEDEIEQIIQEQE